MKLTERLTGTGSLLLEGNRKFDKVEYDIEVWRSDGGLKSLRGTLSVTVEAGPCKLVLKDGSKLNIFVTTSGTYGSTVLVNASRETGSPAAKDKKPG